MRTEDVKIGMKVVPFKKTTHGFNSFESANGWNKQGGKENGFMFVVATCRDRSGSLCFSLWPTLNATGDWYNASDFEPATIEVGDTVRVQKVSRYIGINNQINGVVVKISGNLLRNVRITYLDGDTHDLNYFVSELDLVRKAKRTVEIKPMLLEKEPMFKVGDRVKMVSTNDQHGMLPYVSDVIGAFGTVTKILNRFGIRVKMDYSDSDLCYSPDCFVLTKTEKPHTVRVAIVRDVVHSNIVVVTSEKPLTAGVFVIYQNKKGEQRGVLLTGMLSLDSDDIPAFVKAVGAGANAWPVVALYREQVERL